MRLVHSDIRGPLFVEAQKMIREGTDVLKLNTGNPATFGFRAPDSVRNAIIENIDKATAYCDPQGMPEAREAIRKYHLGKGILGIDTDDIFIGNGVSELVSMAITALVNDGDEILVPSPCYSLWSNAILVAGGRPVYYICDEQNEWNPDVDDIRRKISDRTRAILVINPNNPTGALYTKEILCEIAEIARQNRLILFSDEIYDRLVLDGREHVSMATLAPDLLCITMNGLSKSHIICGYRCGWMVISGNKRGAEDYINGIYQLAAMRLCSNAITQLAIAPALADFDSTRQMLIPGGRLFEQREAAIGEIEKIDGLTCVKNKAAFYIFPKIDTKKYKIEDDRKFAMELLHKKHILIVPGSGFEWHEPDHFRIVMLPEPHRLARAIADIGDFLEGK